MFIKGYVLLKNSSVPMPAHEAVACLIYTPDKSKICLIKRRDVPVWVLPGGGIDPGETPENAALREAEEEVLAHVKLKRLVGVYLPKNRLSRKTYLYELELEGSLQNLKSDETLGVQFFDIHQLPAMPPPYKAWILDGLMIPNGAVTYSYVPGVHYGNFLKLLICHPIKVLRFILSRLGLHWNS